MDQSFAARLIIPMRTSRHPASTLLHLSCLLTLAIALGLTLELAKAGEVSVVRLPEGSMQPRTASAKDGTAQVVFLQGDPKSSQVRLATLGNDGTLSAPLTISAPASTAVGMGTVRGPSIALGRDGTRHLLWHGKAGTATDGKGSALFYAHVDAANKATSPADMLSATSGLDGGAAIAADDKGNVWLVWHGLPQGKVGEAERRVFVRRSTDNGKTFSEPWPIKGEDFGICACCGLAANLSATDELHVLYRTAEETKHRGMRLLRLPANATDQSIPVLLKKDQWDLAACPMTTAQLAPIGDTLSASWVNEFKRQLLAKGLDSLSISGKAMENHPRLTQNAKGETLELWTEGSMWAEVASSSGGSLRPMANHSGLRCASPCLSGVTGPARC